MASKSLGLVLSRTAPARSVPRHTLDSPILPFLVPFTTIRHASGVNRAKKEKAAIAHGKEKKARANFRRDDLKNAQQFALCDAMRYLRAAEVGRPPNSMKYELAVSLKTVKNGPIVRNRMRLPHTVISSQRIAVICRPDSPAAEAALKAGASLVGEDIIFDAIKEGRIEFERLVCHAESSAKLSKANLGRILGPKGLMPSAKTGTIVRDVGPIIREMAGGTEYKEKIGVIRVAIGQLGFTPDQMQSNIKAFMTNVKGDLAALSDKVSKDIHEVVLSSTNGPGFSLDGSYRSPESVSTEDLSV